MTLIFEERPSDSPYVETVTHGYTVGSSHVIRPAESNWHMVFVKYEGNHLPIVTGPLSSSGNVKFTEGAEIVWIRFKLGVFMPHMPNRDMIDSETVLPDASSKSFWLNSASWQFPDYENIETFIDRLVRDEVLVFDTLIDDTLQNRLPDVSQRTVRHRFLQSTGLSQNTIFQMQRAQLAQHLLQSGQSILDTVYEAGYYDQPHLTRSLKQYIGYTPAQIIQMNALSHRVECDPQVSH